MVTGRSCFTQRLLACGTWVAAERFRLLPDIDFDASWVDIIDALTCRCSCSFAGGYPSPCRAASIVAQGWLAPVCRQQMRESLALLAISSI